MINKKIFWGMMAAIVIMFGITGIGCESYMELMDRTTPGWREMEPIQVFPGGSGGGGSSGGSGSSGGGGSTGGNAPSTPQQPPSSGETITRSYTYNAPSSGQAGAGAAAQARAQIVAQATDRFQRENPGFQIRNTEVNEGIGTITVTITGRRN